LHFSIHCDTYFLAQIYFNTTSYEIRNVIFLTFDFFGFWPTIICKNIVKIFHNNDMLKFEYGTLKKQYNVIIILGPFHNVLSPLVCSMTYFSPKWTCTFFNFINGFFEGLIFSFSFLVCYKNLINLWFFMVWKLDIFIFFSCLLQEPY
jgi:hypothetical protein